MVESYIPENHKAKYLELKRLANDPEAASKEKAIELAEGYIPEEYQDKYKMVKQMCNDPDALAEECLEKAGERIPEEHKPKFDMALKLYKDPNSKDVMMEKGIELAEGYIPASYRGFYD